MVEDIFVSYSRKDTARVLPIVRQLREAGYSIWLDDGHIEAASLWAEQIVDGIKSCQVLMLMISEDSINSHNVLKEVMLASELEKVILPVYLEECKLPDRYMYQLAGIQHVDLFKENGQQVVELLSDALSKAGATKLGDNAPLTDDATIPPSGHKFILNKTKFILSSVIGTVIVLVAGIAGGMEMWGGEIEWLFHGLEQYVVLMITIGALVFSYRSSAFKPWLVPFGVGVPEEEEIIRKYIKVCASATSITLFAMVLVTILRVIITLSTLGTAEELGKGIAAFMGGLVTSIAIICAIVLPTKFKLESLLSDRKVFEAQLREKQRRLDNLKKDWAKDFKKD